uniref:Beta-galactosidase n=1 Tax=Rhizophora mucronata TaxID=61149 RepID=A0A2P2KSI6_RHIMU
MQFLDFLVTHLQGNSEDPGFGLLNK